MHIYRAAPGDQTQRTRRKKPAPPDGHGRNRLAVADSLSPRRGSNIPVVVNGQSFGDTRSSSREPSGRLGRDLGFDRQVLRHRGRRSPTATLLLMSLMIAPPVEADQNHRQCAHAARRRQLRRLRARGGTAGVRRHLRQAQPACGNTESGRSSENRRLAETRSFASRMRSARIWRASCTTSSAPICSPSRAGASTHAQPRGGTRHRRQAEKFIRTCDTLLERIEAMQRMNRRVLQKLRPMRT